MPEDLPNLRHLYATAEIARRGSISKAARQVHLSQSAVTQGLAGLERLAGEQLFTRSGAGLSPTPAGGRFIARVERAFQRLKSIESEISPGRASGAEPLHRRMTSTQLRALIAVVETGGFSLAARELGLSQASVYRSAKELERLCGSRFFRRTAKGVDATPVAQQLARCASLAFAEVRQGFEEVNELHGRMQSRVAVGCLPLARAQVLPDAVSRLLAAHPSVHVKIVDGPYDELLYGLLNGKLDMIIGALREPPPTSHILQAPLFEDVLSIVVRRDHPLLGGEQPDAAELARLDWVVPREGTPARSHFSAFFSQHGVEAPRRVIECSSLIAARGLLMQSDRAALLSVRQVRLDIESGQLALLCGPLPGTARPIGLTVRRDWQPTGVQSAFIEEVRRASAD